MLEEKIVFIGLMTYLDIINPFNDRQGSTASISDAGVGPSRTAVAMYYM